MRTAASVRAQGHDVITPVDRPIQAIKRANLRSGPGTSFDKVGLLEPGEQVWVTGEAGDGLRVRLPSGRTAFVYAPLLGSVAAAPDPRAAVRCADRVHRAVWHIHNLKGGRDVRR